MSRNHSAELHDIFSHQRERINCLWNALAFFHSESLFISFQINWDWLGSWHLLSCTQKKGDYFSFLNLAGHYIGKIKMELYLSVWGTGFLGSQEWLIFLVNVISEMIKVIVIHQICFQFCLALAVFDLLEWFMAWTHNISQDAAVTMHLFLLVTGYKCLASYFFWLVWASFPLLDLFLSFWHSIEKLKWEFEEQMTKQIDRADEEAVASTGIRLGQEWNVGCLFSKCMGCLSLQLLLTFCIML